MSENKDSLATSSSSHLSVTTSMYHSLKIRSLLSYPQAKCSDTARAGFPSRELKNFHKWQKLAEGQDPTCLSGLEDQFARMLNFEEQSGSRVWLFRGSNLVEASWRGYHAIPVALPRIL